MTYFNIFDKSKVGVWICQSAVFKRDIEPIIIKFSQIFPIIGITGPRQSGKTTIAKKVFSHLKYVSLENLDVRGEAKNDPKGFLEKYAQGAIFDEAQHVPELCSYLQTMVDASDEKGKFVLTGSQNFALNEKICQSLAGRIGMLTLQPMGAHEIFAQEKKNSSELIFQGGYPALHKLKTPPTFFYPSYIQTFLERDVRQFKNIANFDRFRIFLKMCAARIGQIINFSSLAQDCGISPTTAKEWINILQANYIIFLVHPFFKNFNKRLIKMPKLYFYDTGVACSLLDIKNTDQLDFHYLKGSLFENLIILEVVKNRLNKALSATVYFFRDRTGREIDLICQWGGQIHAIEIKSGQTFSQDMVKQLEYFEKLDPEAKKHLIYAGDRSQVFNNTQVSQIEDLYDLF